MTPFYTDDAVTLFHGDCLEVLASLPDASVDSVVTDPPYGLGFMGREWDDLPPGVEFAAECLRVLKPGGHMLAFGGSRTWHRLTCAIEDAGFEIRDSIAWLYGSGFPKSLDVSKAIDKKRHDHDDWRRVGAWLRTQRESLGMSAKSLCAAIGAYGEVNHGGAVSNWEKGFSCPTWEQWTQLREVLQFGDELDDEVRRLNGRKGTPGEAWQNAEVIGTRERVMSGWSMDGATKFVDREDKAPATPDAQRWQGWGTALKPAWESIVVATKPHDMAARIGSRLDDLEASCKRPANAAALSSVPTPHGLPEAMTATAPESAATRHEGANGKPTRTGAAVDSSEATATSASGSMDETCWNIVTSWKDCWAALCEPMSMSTTSTTTNKTTDLATLSSCLDRLTHPNTLLDPTSPDGLSSLARVVDALFAAAVLNLNATRTLIATEPATSPTPPSSPVAGGIDAIVVARKPLISTVAANVLAYGTGALNVDGCRVEGEPWSFTHSDKTGRTAGILGEPRAREGVAESHPAGRWPSNVVLDESQAAELDRQSGTLHSQAPTNPSTMKSSHFGGGEPTTRQNHYDDTGASSGASRFFPTFRYEPKAPTTERPDADGTRHPTVKPLDLMRWLVRLVTPPGGTVLEPFAGSGTTAEACVVEGFKCVAIEREADYLPLIVQRLTKPIQVALEFD